MKDEAELLKEACEGNVQAQSQLFEKRIDPLIRLAYLITHDHAAAEDAVQEALISSTRHLGTLRESDRFDAWLRRIVVNHAKTARRRGARLIPCENVTAHLDAEECAPSPEAALLRREEERRILRAVDALSDKLRVPILMKYYMDMKERDIAQALRLPVTTVKSRLHAARKKLRGLLEREERMRETLQ